MTLPTSRESGGPASVTVYLGSCVTNQSVQLTFHIGNRADRVACCRYLRQCFALLELLLVTDAHCLMCRLSNGQVTALFVLHRAKMPADIASNTITADLAHSKLNEVSLDISAHAKILQL